MALLPTTTPLPPHPRSGAAVRQQQGSAYGAPSQSSVMRLAALLPPPTTPSRKCLPMSNGLDSSSVPKDMEGEWPCDTDYWLIRRSETA